MIKEIDGDLLSWPEGVNVIAHQANCFHTFGAGIARVIATKYPEAYEADAKSEHGSADKLGSFTVATVENGTKRIVNIYGQFSTSRSTRQTRYDALYDGLDRLARMIRTSKSPEQYVIGVPYGIGCGLGGGSWMVVRAMLEKIFGKSSITLVIVKLPGAQVEE